MTTLSRLLIDNIRSISSIPISGVSTFLQYVFVKLDSSDSRPVAASQEIVPISCEIEYCFPAIPAGLESYRTLSVVDGTTWEF